MPFYEYECTACKFYVEALQKISDPPLNQCPSCKKQTMKRLLSAPVFRLKGGGWYETDFKSDSEQKRNLAGREEAAESKSADEGKAKAETGKTSDTQAEPKPASKTAAAKPAAKKSARKAAAKPAKRKPAAKAKKSRR